MKISPRSFVVSIFLLVTSGLFAQNKTNADSVLRIVDKTNSYSKKIALLQSNIEKSYLTDFDGTILLARHGYHLAEQRKDALNKGEFLRNIGGAIGRRGDIDSAAVYYYKALDILKPTKNAQKLGLLYDDLARTYRKLNEPKRALKFYDAALGLYTRDNDLEGIARINNESGVVFRDMGDHTEATRRFEKSLKIQQQRKDSVGIGYSLEFLGYTQLLMKNYDAAREYLLEALKIRKTQKDPFALMLNYTALGEYYHETGEWATSNEFFFKSNEIATSISFPDIKKYNFEQIVGNYEALNDYSEALRHLRIFQALNDSLFNIERIKNIEDVSARHETAEKEKQILEQRAQLAEGDLKLERLTFIVIGIVALFLFTGIFIYLFISKQRLKHSQYKKEVQFKEALLRAENTEKLQEQRLRISRDLHDNIGAQLSFIISSLDTAAYVMDSTSVVKARLDTIKSFTAETIAELRDTIWAMNLSNISIEDLRSRITNFFDKASLSGLALNFELNMEVQNADQLTFSSSEGLNIYRIVQEAVNNAVKYAGADRISVFILCQRALIIEIKDNGRGFDPDTVEQGNGILNMQKRAEELNGEISIESEQGKGTRIELKLRPALP